MNNIQMYLEIGPKRTIAGALEWPGWCRSGRDESAALQALLDYEARYALVLNAAEVDFPALASGLEFVVAERLPGNGTTDFGVPSLVPEADRRAFDSPEYARVSKLLLACWQAIDRAAQAAAGKELRKGPRGGGRELEEILRHVLDADKSYLARLGWKGVPAGGVHLQDEVRQVRQSTLDGLSEALKGELPVRGPRGGEIWLPRYFVRRTAWHVLDHAWEIEDRIG